MLSFSAKRNQAAAAVALALVMLGSTSWLAAQEPGDDDFAELELEELIEVQNIPVDVSGSHIHRKGEWMLAYKYMLMGMDGNRSGETRLSPEQVLETFRVTPTRMDMEMHMFELMYGLTDRVTLMAMAPYHRREMDHVTRTGVEFTTVSEGVGDLALMSHIVLARRGANWWIFTPGLSLPTGSIDERDATPAGPNSKLPYPMQLGSGSVDLTSIFNFIHRQDDWTTGLHARATVSLNDNDNDYKVGNRYSISGFASYRFSPSLATGIDLIGKRAENYSGADPDLNRLLVPTADPDLRAGERIDLEGSLTLYIEDGKFARNRFRLQVAVPIHQSLTGPQLETDLTAGLSWQWTF